MIFINKLLFLAFTLLFIAACDSKLVTQEDQDIVSELKSLEDPDSGFELIENSNIKSQISCNPTNSIKFVSIQNQKDKILCKESSDLDKTLKLGPICPGGVEIKNISSRTEWVPCETLSVCGVPASSVIDLRSAPEAQLKQIQFANLPWGCKSEILLRKASSEEVINKINIDIKVPLCPTCKVNNSQTCEICGDDKTPPVITDIFTESFQCNSIRVLIFAEDDNAGIAEKGYSFDGGKTWQSESFKDIKGLELSVPSQSYWVRDRAGNITKYSKPVSATSSPCPCATPWGETIAHGQSRVSFKTATVSCTTTCDANSSVRVCNNGVLSGADDFKVNSCTVVGCPKCRLPWGEEIENGVSVDAFDVASAPCAGECKKSTLRCDRGNLIGNASLYKNKKCEFSKPSCDCSHAGVVVKNGQTRKVFSANEVNCGSSCTEGEVRCTSGTLTGQLSYLNLSCSTKICKCTTAWGELINLNETRDAYKKDQMDCGQSLACSHSSNKIKIKCTDVATNKFDVIEGSGAINEFTKPTCSAAACGCSHLGVIFKPTDPPLKVYKLDKAVSPAKCNVAGNFGTVTCAGSSPNFRVTGDTNTSVFKFLTCDDKPVPGTGVGTGESPLDVGVGTGGGAGGGIGDGEGDGEGFSRRLKGGGGGGGCDINKSPYYCWGSSGGAVVDSSFCLLPGLNGYSMTNTNSDNFKQRISHGGALVVYSKKEVACSDSCTKYMKVVSCDQGVMSSKTQYKFLNCREVCP